MEPMDRMFIEHECAKLSTQYCIHLDHHDEEGFAGIFTEDGMYKPAALAEPMYGRPAILDWIRAYPKDRLGRHLATNVVVDVIDGEHATGTSYAVVFRDPAPRADELSTQVIPRSVVEYFDKYRRADEGWRISQRYYQVKFMQESETNRPLPWTPAGD